MKLCCTVLKLALWPLARRHHYLPTPHVVDRRRGSGQLLKALAEQRQVTACRRSYAAAGERMPRWRAPAGRARAIALRGANHELRRTPRATESVVTDAPLLSPAMQLGAKARLAVLGIALLALTSCGGGEEKKDRGTGHATRTQETSPSRPDGGAPGKGGTSQEKTNDSNPSRRSGPRPRRPSSETNAILRKPYPQAAERLCKAFRSLARGPREHPSVEPQRVDPKKACDRLRKAARSQDPRAFGRALGTIERESYRRGP